MRFRWIRAAQIEPQRRLPGSVIRQMTINDNSRRICAFREFRVQRWWGIHFLNRIPKANGYNLTNVVEKLYSPVGLNLKIIAASRIKKNHTHTNKQKNTFALINCFCLAIIIIIIISRQLLVKLAITLSRCHVAYVRQPYKKKKE